MASAVSQLTSLSRLRLRRPLLHFGDDQYTLYVSIGVMFSIFMATLGIVLITYNFEKNKATALLAASQLFDHVAQQTAISLSELYAPAETLVDLTAQLSTARAQSLEERLPLVKYFAESLRVNEHLSAAYIGYANGAFFLVRAVSHHPAARLSLAAPENTAFAVQSIEREADGTARYENLYFDDRLRRIGNETRLHTGFDPRIRDWYQAAVRTPDRITTDFYVFFTTHEIGATVARRLPDGAGVVGADLTVRSLSAVVNSHSVTPSTEIIIFDDDGNVLAYRDPDRLVRQIRAGSRTTVRRAHITDIGSPIIDDLFRAFVSGARDGQLDLQRAGEHWFGSITPLSFEADKQVYLSILVPEIELLADVERTRFRSVILSIAFLVVAIVLVWWTSRQISRPVQALAREADYIRQLQLNTPIVVHSRISEVADLSAAMTLMKTAIRRFVEIGKALSAEPNLGRLLEMIVREAQVACRAEWGSVLLVRQDKTTLDTMFICRNPSDGSPSGSRGRKPYPAISLYDDAGVARTNSIEASVVHTGETIKVDNVAAENRFDFQNLFKTDESATAYTCRSLLAVPLKNHQGKVIGVLELANPRDPQTGALLNFHTEVITIVESLAATAAVAIEKQRLLEKQQDWLTELQDSERRYRILIEGSIQGIAILDGDGRCLFANKALASIFGYKDHQDAQGRSLTDQIVPRDRVRILEPEQFRRSEQPVSARYELQGVRTDASPMCLETLVSQLEWDDKPAILCTFFDITERKRTEQEILEISEREQQRLGQDLHDGLGQHLTGLAFLNKGLEQKLRAQSVPEVTEVAHLGTLIDQAITQTRDLARGMYPVVLETEGFVAACRHLARQAEALSDIAIEVSTDGTLPQPDYQSAVHLYRIAQEAINNAIKHGHAHRIMLQVDRDEQGLRLRIDDDGTGLPIGVETSHGMGLRIMRYRARMIGASFDIRSGPQGGTRVTCILPVPTVRSTSGRSV